MALDLFDVRLFEALAFPPAGPLIVAVVGALLALRWRRSGFAVMLIAWLALYLASTPLVAGALLASLERYPALPPQQLNALGAEAIVVLGANTYYSAPEYGANTSGTLELERVRYAAWLHRRTGLPIAAMGGDPLTPGANRDLMDGVLEEDFQVPVRWSSPRSRNTHDNARFAAELLEPDGIRRILLVTHAWHMPRAANVFMERGFEVVPAPTAFETGGPKVHTGGRRAFLPRGSSLVHTNWALHELLGGVWYRRHTGGDVPGRILTLDDAVPVSTELP